MGKGVLSRGMWLFLLVQRERDGSGAAGVPIEAVLVEVAGSSTKSRTQGSQDHASDRDGRSREASVKLWERNPGGDVRLRRLTTSRSPCGLSSATCRFATPSEDGFRRGPLKGAGGNRMRPRSSGWQPSNVADGRERARGERRKPMCLESGRGCVCVRPCGLALSPFRETTSQVLHGGQTAVK